MNVIQGLLALHGQPVKATAQARVKASLDSFWERQKMREQTRREAPIRRKPRNERRPNVIPGQTSRAEHRMILNALSLHEEIIARERRDYITPLLNNRADGLRCSEGMERGGSRT